MHDNVCLGFGVNCIGRRPSSGGVVEENIPLLKLLSLYLTKEIYFREKQDGLPDSEESFDGPGQEDLRCPGTWS